VYNAVATKLWKFKTGGWRKKLWKWDCPLKIKLFAWLVVENKILTWKNLQKRGWVGPGICHLCKGKRESGKHLFVHLFVNFPFTISVWNKVKLSLKYTNGWYGQTMNECFENWAKQNFDYPTLPAFICWFIWLERNKTIFEVGTPSIQKIVFQAIEAVSIYRKKVKEIHSRTITFDCPEDRIMGWFDGAAQQNGEQSGAGGWIKINKNTSYKWTLNCGRGTNTRA
jgi:hypothetical protein